MNPAVAQVRAALEGEAGGNVVEMPNSERHSRLLTAAGDGTEGALARHFAERHDLEFKYVGAERDWCAFDGKAWRMREGLAARKAMQELVRSFYRAAAATRDPDDRATLGRFAARADRARFQSGALELAAAFMRVEPHQLDADPWRLNVRNGILDLREQRLRPHDPTALWSKVAGAAYRPEADCPHWRAAVERWTGGDPEQAALLQRLAGYALVGDASEQRLPIAHGPGANGKSVFTRALLALLGDFGTAFNLQTLLDRQRSAGAASPDLLAFRGKRLACASETADGVRFNESLIKSLTGGERIVARPLYGMPVEFAMQATILLGTNRLPRVADGDEATWRRLLVVPFAVTIPPAERDPHLFEDRLAPEIESGGILNWALDGLRAWQARGLGDSPAARAATSAYRTAEDLTGRFLELRCALAPDRRARRPDLAAAWAAFLADEGEREVSPRMLFRRLRESGLPEIKAHGGVRHFEGIGLL